MPLLRKGANSQEDSDTQRVRAEFLPTRDYVSLDVRVLGDFTCISNVC